MSFAETVLLGGLAGLTIYLSLPFGRLQMLSDRARVGLAMFAVGVLAFLFVDVFEHALHIAEEAVEGYEAGEGSLGKAIGFPLMLAGGFARGLRRSGDARASHAPLHRPAPDGRRRRPTR